MTAAAATAPLPRDVAGSFMFTFSGRRVDLPKPLPGQVHIEDIAVHLARLNRFCGATMVPRSVAAHSMHVATLAANAGAPPEVQMAALLHDAHEAYSGDQTSPWKRAVASITQAAGLPCPMRHAENMLQREVMTQLGVWYAFKDARTSIHHWDLVSLMTERRDLAPAASLTEHWAGLDHITPDPTAIAHMRGMSTDDIAADFLDHYSALIFQIGQQAALEESAVTNTTSETTTAP